MSTLRIYIDDVPDPRREMDWALFDAGDRVVRNGRGRRDVWPSADALEGVVAAARGRIVTLTLPPIPATRAVSAVRFAMEDQLAGAPEDVHLASAPQAADGSIRVAIASQPWLRALADASTRMDLSWRRIVLESDLARAPAAGWCWCARSIDVSGFVCTAQGPSFGVGPARSDAPPDELLLAVAARRQPAPRRIRADVAGASSEWMTRASAVAGVEFVAGTPWVWFAAAPSAWGAAIDLRSVAPERTAMLPRDAILRALRPAAWILACALGVQVIASVGQWAWLVWQSSQVRRDIAALAQGAAPEEIAAGAAPSTALARRDAVLRHQAGRAADDDALPLLARASPALTLLPAGALRSLRYADGHVVAEVQGKDDAQTMRVQRELQRAGLVAIAVPVATGTRIRIGLD